MQQPRADTITCLLTWGEGLHGELGHGARRNEWLPRICTGLVPHRLRSVCCGSATTLVLTASGDVHGCGSGEGGVLGLGDKKDRLTPREIVALRGMAVVSLACAERHAVALSASGELFCWGQGSDRQPACVPDSTTPMEATGVAAVLSDAMQRHEAGRKASRVAGLPTQPPEIAAGRATEPLRAALGASTSEAVMIVVVETDAALLLALQVLRRATVYNPQYARSYCPRLYAHRLSLTYALSCILSLSASAYVARGSTCTYSNLLTACSPTPRPRADVQIRLGSAGRSDPRGGGEWKRYSTACRPGSVGASTPE